MARGENIMRMKPTLKNQRALDEVYKEREWRGQQKITIELVTTTPVIEGKHVVNYTFFDA